jgi:hypothetical protein
MRLASFKLPIKTKVVTLHVVPEETEGC